MGGSKKQTVGYKYYLGEHMVLCHGPIDYIKSIKVDEKIAWEGDSEGGTIAINKPDLFGGESREGGISGNVDILMGEATQGQNSYLAAILGSTVPAYRGVVSAVLRQCYLGNNPYLKAWSFRATRIQKSNGGAEQWYPEKAAIAASDADTTYYNLSLTGGDIPPGSRAVSGVIGGNYGFVIEASKFATITVEPLLPISGTNIASDPQGDGTWKWILSWVGDDNAANVGVFNIPGNPGYATPQLAVAAAQAAQVSSPQSATGFSKYRFWVNLEAVSGVVLPDKGGLTARIKVVDGQIDMNPAHIVRECLTNADWGMGYQESDIDDASFEAAADVLLSEGLGMSLLWDRQMVLEDFLKEVVRHIDAALYVSRTTGKFTLKLIRNDYDPDDLIVLDESNVTKVSNPNKPTFGELSNSVSVTFWDHISGKDATVTITDTALVQMQGQVIGTTLQYPGFSNRRNATLAAQRDLRALSASFLSCTIYANKDARALNIGDTFKFTWPRWQIYNMVMRVSGVAFGDGKSNQVRVTCSQDVFSTPSAVVVAAPGTEWVDPSGPPSIVIDQMAAEIPYYELAQNLGQTTIDTTLASNPEVGYVMAAAPKPVGAINARIWTDDSTGYEDAGTLDFCPYAVTVSDITPTQTSITVGSMSELDDVTIGTFVQLGTGNVQMELCRVDAINTGTGVVTLGRGCLDTTPKPHPAGTPLFFWDQFSGYDPGEYVLGETVGTKITAVTGGGQLSLLDAVEIEVPMAQRAFRPYPPGAFQINATYYPADINPFLGALTITWADRDRVQQTATAIYDHTTGGIGPEAGTQYRVQGYVNGILVHTEEPATSGTTWAPVEGILTIEVHSLRDGVYSLQPATHEFQYTLGEVRLTVDGDMRSSETSDNEIRVTED